MFYTARDSKPRIRWDANIQKWRCHQLTTGKHGVGDTPEMAFRNMRRIFYG
jgi:hypothetical protein